MPDAGETREREPGGIPFSPAIALVTVARTVEVRVAGILEPLGLTVRKLGVLGHVAATPGLALSDLGRRMRLAGASVQSTVRALGDAGLVRFTTEAGAIAQLTATPHGGELLARVRAELAALDAELFAAPGWDGLGDALADLVAREAPRATGPVD